jgi:hypothetical protein
MPDRTRRTSRKEMKNLGLSSPLSMGCRCLGCLGCLGCLAGFSDMVGGEGGSVDLRLRTNPASVDIVVVLGNGGSKSKLTTGKVVNHSINNRPGCSQSWPYLQIYIPKPAAESLREHAICKVRTDDQRDTCYKGLDFCHIGGIIDNCSCTYMS